MGIRLALRSTIHNYSNKIEALFIRKLQRNLSLYITNYKLTECIYLTFVILVNDPYTRAALKKSRIIPFRSLRSL